MKYFRITVTVLLIVWMLLIFCLSAQNATESSGTSGNFISAVLRIFNPQFDDLSEIEKSELIAPFQFIVRKGAHFLAYALLGGLAFLTVITYKCLSLKLRFLLALLISLLYSVSDEIHQYFVPGRSCELRDVLIDFGGAFLMISFLLLLSKKSRFKNYI